MKRFVWMPSAVCAVHCAAMPLFSALAGETLGHHEWVHDLEWGLTLVVMLLVANTALELMRQQFPVLGFSGLLLVSGLAMTLFGLGGHTAFIALMLTSAIYQIVASRLVRCAHAHGTSSSSVSA